jgi:cell division protein FtsW
MKKTGWTSGKKASERKSAISAPAVRSVSAVSAHNFFLLISVLCLVGIGIVMVYSASSALAGIKYKTQYHFLKKQAICSILGLIAMIACRHIPLKLFRTLAYPILVLAIGCLAAVFIPQLGFSAGGATRWLKISHITIQPSEFARFALAIFLAYSLGKKYQHIKTFSIGFLPHLFLLLVFAGLLFFQPDFGTILIFFAIAWIMMFSAGVPVLHLLAPLLILIPVLVFFMIFEPYRLQRLLVFWDPWQYPSTGGYQIIHSLMAFGTGGLIGTGLGQSYQKLFYLPEPHTDFIFSVIGEEGGLLGVMVIIALYAVIVWHGIFAARNARDLFACFLAIGITAGIGLQVCINMGVALGLLPTKGLTLPFLSYGGTSLLVNMASMGLLMNIGERGES